MKRNCYKCECKLKSIRMSRGYTQTELAQKIGVSKNAISDYECGKAFPKIDVVLSICEVLCCYIEDVIGIRYCVHDCQSCIHCNFDTFQVGSEKSVSGYMCSIHDDFIIYPHNEDYLHRVICDSYQERPIDIAEYCKSIVLPF